MLVLRMMSVGVRDGGLASILYSMAKGTMSDVCAHPVVITARGTSTFRQRSRIDLSGTNSAAVRVFPTPELEGHSAVLDFSQADVMVSFGWKVARADDEKVSDIVPAFRRPSRNKT
jgi:hypothetical protein